MAEFRKYDTDSNYTCWAARLTKDAEVKDFGDRQLVRLNFADSSRMDSDEDIWIEANPSDRDAALAKCLKKGDTIGIEGKLTMRRYGDNKEKVAFNIRFAKLHVPIALLMECKEKRGFTPGAASSGGNGKAPAKANKPAARPTVEIPDED